MKQKLKEMDVTTKITLSTSSRMENARSLREVRPGTYS
jgi:hypothetical protein